MKIIIIGEYSSFSKNLSEGFRQLGHKCFVFSWGDGFKEINQNKENSYIVNLGYLSKSAGFWNIVRFELKSIIASLRLKRYVYDMSKKEKWDTALIINPGFIKRKKAFWQAKFTKNMIESLLRDHSQIYMSACGNDIPLYDYWKDHPWKNRQLVEVGMNRCYTDKEKKHFSYCMSFVNKVIPVGYIYAEAWRNSDYTKNCIVLPTIPLPVVTSNYQVKNDLKEKIVIFHGIIRPEEKGTPIIVEAMNRVQEKYPNEVECAARGGMPLNEYLLLLGRTNILIDQTYSDSVGMNGLYALAMGKVVLGGNTIEAQREYGGAESPVVNISPDSEQIFKELEKLVLNRERIAELSLKSRRYVEEVHDAKVIAKQYIKAFQKTGNAK